MHSTSLWSAFLAIEQQGRALERAFVALNCLVPGTEEEHLVHTDALPVD